MPPPLLRHYEQRIGQGKPILPSHLIPLELTIARQFGTVMGCLSTLYLPSVRNRPPLAVELLVVEQALVLRATSTPGEAKASKRPPEHRTRAGRRAVLNVARGFAL
jgi:hypothetical protein